MKRIILAVAVLALVAPGLGQAEQTSYRPAYALGPQGGDANNTFMVDPETGEMTVIRHQLAGISGGLGCGGSGGFANFKVNHSGTNIREVSVQYQDAIIDPYTWINVGVRQGTEYVGTQVQRGLTTGHGQVRVLLAKPVSGDIEVWFGIQVSSACPNIDGGTALFTAVHVFEN